LAAAAVKRDGLCDCDGPETRRIESVDLTARCGLRNGACEGLARSGTAAGIDIITRPGHPGAGGLSVAGTGGQYTKYHRKLADSDFVHGNHSFD
jgi:hypothetical protein